jgi:hypothetical protein
MVQTFLYRKMDKPFIQRRLTSVDRVFRGCDEWDGLEGLGIRKFKACFLSK